MSPEPSNMLPRAKTFRSPSFVTGIPVQSADSNPNFPEFSSGLPSPIGNQLSRRSSQQNMSQIELITPQRTELKTDRPKIGHSRKAQSISHPYNYTPVANDEYEEHMLQSNREFDIESDAKEININNPNQVYDIDQKMGDPYVKLKIENLWNFKKEPLENYDVQKLFEDNAANIDQTYGESRGMSKFMNEDGKIVWKACEILEYNAETGLFLIRWRDNGQTKHV